MTLVLTAADYEGNALGDRIRGVKDLLDLIREFDLTKLSRAIDAIRALIAAEGLKARVQAALTVLRTLADMTANEVDDKLVAMIESVATPEMIDALVRIIDAFTRPSASADDTAVLAEARACASAKAIPWSFLMGLATQIMELLREYLPQETE